MCCYIFFEPGFCPTIMHRGTLRLPIAIGTVQYCASHKFIMRPIYLIIISIFSILALLGYSLAIDFRMSYLTAQITGPCNQAEAEKGYK